MFSLQWRQLPESVWGAAFSLVLVPQAPEFGTQNRQAEVRCCPLMFEILMMSLRGWEMKADWRSLHCSTAGLTELNQTLLSYKSPLSAYDNIFDPSCWVTCFTFGLLLHLAQRWLFKNRGFAAYISIWTLCLPQDVWNRHVFIRNICVYFWKQD